MLASPKNRLKTRCFNRENSAGNVEMTKTSSTYSICSDGGIEFTPPHKKLANLNESQDFSPNVLDSSFSPTTFTSQAVIVESPEVGWKWNNSSNSSMELKTHTPDSAIVRNSSSASCNSSSIESYGISNANRMKISNNLRRRKLGRKIENEFRQLERIRAENSLKQRCIKLQQQLTNAGTSNSINNVVNIVIEDQESESAAHIDELTDLNNVNDVMKQETDVINDETNETNSQAKPLDEFFNDSFTDLILSSATEEIESQMYTQTRQITETSTPTKNTLEAFNNSDIKNSMTPTNNKNGKHSFYMKFLEDDCTDDLLLSLDDVILQDNQSKKSKSLFQRYKSMPTANQLEYKTEPTPHPNTVKSTHKTSPTSDSRCIKRHSSSQLLKPTALNNAICKLIISEFLVKSIFNSISIYFVLSNSYR